MLDRDMFFKYVKGYDIILHWACNVGKTLVQLGTNGEGGSQTS
jgi:hypothetical protein